MGRILRWLFGNGGRREEGYIDGLNQWFGSVAGIKQSTAFVAIWTAWNVFGPIDLRFDRWPLMGIVYVITVFSLTSNQFLMNKSIRVERMNETQAAQQEAILAQQEAIFAHVVSLVESLVEKEEERDAR